jgi:hypothetical protein
MMLHGSSASLPTSSCSSFAVHVLQINSISHVYTSPDKSMLPVYLPSFTTFTFPELLELTIVARLLPNEQNIHRVLFSPEKRLIWACSLLHTRMAVSIGSFLCWWLVTADAILSTIGWHWLSFLLPAQKLHQVFQNNIIQLVTAGQEM